MSLRVEIRKRPPEGFGYILAPEGSLDTETHEYFENKAAPYLDGAARILVLDMAKVNYVSSAGLRAIYKVWQNVTKHACQFILTNVQPQVQVVFDVMKVMPHESVFASMAEADEYLDKLQKQELERLQREGKNA